ncbi:RidA family protein [Egicoccus halophilus]|uniref:RidA family protein n=1 Tax=Egicoccus halophilus TaxID=1670830 RepID=A0A8J3ESI8_9ACTN|nr:RidA family protein [Egicoccus halophilus]GGI07542.1 hypothetical protein GCM10011354_24610 [Egicoccus halophilus]
MPAKRQVIEVEGLGHGDNPIPVAVKAGGWLFTGTVPGIDRATGTFPDQVATEIANAFDNLGAVLEAAGVAWGDVTKVDVSLRDKAHRNFVNDNWLKYFPDDDDRPVRHVSRVDLPGEMNIQLQIVAMAS